MCVPDIQKTIPCFSHQNQIWMFSISKNFTRGRWGGDEGVTHSIPSPIHFFSFPSALLPPPLKNINLKLRNNTWTLLLGPSRLGWIDRKDGSKKNLGGGFPLGYILRILKIKVVGGGDMSKGFVDIGQFTILD